MKDLLMCQLAICSAVGFRRSKNVVGILSSNRGSPTTLPTRRNAISKQCNPTSMNKLLITGALLLSIASAKAQFVYDYLKAADNYYKQADYYSATQYYEKYLATKEVTGYNPYADV